MYKKEAPFMTSSPRFTEEEASAAPKTEKRGKNSLLNKLISEALKQRIPRMPFNQSDERFKEVNTTKREPGPGEYELDRDKWNKQTFNLRFIK